MDVSSYLIVCGSAFLVAALTLFSGFGLGTLLMPVFALFFPLPLAVAATAVVHALNNLFKLGLLYRHAQFRLLILFGLPAVAAAFPGAWLLTRLSLAPPLASWQFAGIEAEVTPVKLTLGFLILGFALIELLPVFKRVQLPSRYLFLGGMLSGFFGGLSGHQGALRAMFLSRVLGEPLSFAATQAALAMMVDVARLTVYGLSFISLQTDAVVSADNWSLVALASLAAFAGSFLGRRLLPKVTMSFVRASTAALLFLVGGGLSLGLV